MTVGAPRSTVNPHFREFERVGVRLSLSFESRPAPAKDRNSLGLAVLFDDNCGASKPFTGANLLRIELDRVGTVNLGSHPDSSISRVNSSQLAA